MAALINIRSTPLRRITICLAFVPLALLGLVVHLASATWEYVVDVMGAARAAWRGRKDSFWEETNDRS
jgi:hypothetical protein